MARFRLTGDRARLEANGPGPAPGRRSRTAAQATGGKQPIGGARAGAPRRMNALWFFIALFGGGIAVWWTKSATTNAWIAALVAASVVLALTTYYILNGEDAPEEEGDNVYYLGLLFTLLSLIFTLVELFGADINVVPSAERIGGLLENFGIALTSTVVGIAGRVAVQNWQLTGVDGRPEFSADTEIPALAPQGTSPLDLERFNRRLLGRISRDLIQGVNALARFHRIVRSHASDVEDHLREHSKALERENNEFKDRIHRESESFTQYLQTEAANMLASVGASLSAAAQRAEALVEQLQTTQNSYLAEVRETTRVFHDEIRAASGQSLEALRENFDIAAQRSISLTQNVSTAHERIGTAFGSLESGLEGAKDASMAFGDASRQATKATAALEAEVNKLHPAFTALHAGAETMKTMLNAMEDLDRRLRAGRDTERTAHAVRHIGESLQTISAQAVAVTEQVARLTELFGAFTQSVRATEGETRRAAEALRVLVKEAEDQTETLRQRQGRRFPFWNRSR